MSGTAVLCYLDANGNPVAVSAANPLPLNNTGPASIPESEKGQPNGVATLDASGKVPTSQLPVGDVTYKGNWNATTNTPTLADGVGDAGDLYICDVAGTQNLGGGDVAYSVGDWLIYDGAVWDRVPAASAAPANPTATVGLTAKNGTAPTFMRSDAAPALDPSVLHGLFAAIVATDGKVNQAANVNSPTFYPVTVSGMYRFSAYVVVSQAATTSSTMPSCSVSYTEATTGVVVQDMVTTTATNNQVGLHSGGSVVIAAQQGSNIGYITSNYASSGATPMQYAVRVKVEYLGG
jgi:hypothetical protein